MKKELLLAYCLILPCLLLSAQSKDEQSVAKAVQQLKEAMIDANHIMLDELTSKKLSYGHSNGLIEDKNAYLTAIVDGVSGFTSIDLTDQTIALSDNVAIVRHKMLANTDNKGQQPGKVSLGVLQIWQKEKGRWLLLARHATRL
jgi:ketosteroid isomerase-like protein